MPSQRNNLRDLIAAACVVCLTTGAVAQPVGIETSARSAIVVDHLTGTVLMEKEAETPLPPASMSKLMTLYMVFEALQEGRLSLDDTIRVSTKAWQMGGSKMFLREGDEVRIEDLIRGVIVQSGNDACVVLAEGLAGSESAFAQRMTRRAREIGLMDSVFANSTGWPHPDHRMSARDLVKLAQVLIEQFPEYYPYFAETSFVWEDIEQENRNPLLSLDIGADGLKTGHTEEAGYGLVGSAMLDGRRVNLMVTGLNSSRDRLVESERLLNWAFREFYTKELFEADREIVRAEVWLGDAPDVGLVSPDGVTAVISYVDKDNLKARIEYDGPIEAPVEKGQVIGQLVLDMPGIGETVYPLAAAEDVPRGGFLTRVTASGQLLGNKLLETVLGGL